LNLSLTIETVLRLIVKVEQVNQVKTFEINIIGIVQGVGFRPFLYNLAKGHGLNGYILNRGNAGVRLRLQGPESIVNQFVKDIEIKKPQISYLEEIQIKEDFEKDNYTSLEIRKSESGRGIGLTLPPDIAICDNCLEDMRNSKLPKYYNYPFIACALCGPRFTTVRDLPYDRIRTTMDIFPFCSKALPESCIEEYSDFNNRRFHAQTFACSVCGPQYTLYDDSKNIIDNRDIKNILKKVAKCIHDGGIVAVKGIGGVHLVGLADNDEVVLKLRMRKGKRANKPFAIMVPNLQMLENNYVISSKERDLMTSFRRPIVLLQKKAQPSKPFISQHIAPGLHNIGVMLPYSGIHYLLYDYVGQRPLIYTSGNRSSIPMAIENDLIFEQLNKLADLFLLHDRPIYQRADDSVLRIHDNMVKLIRRSRGYVPEYIPLPFNVDVPAALATGPELTSTGAVLRNNRIFPTQYIGNVVHLETYEFLQDAIMHMKKLLQVKDDEFKFVCCDLHPAFLSTRLAEDLAKRLTVPLIQVQHHYAHALGLMAENKVRETENTVIISTDGVGYGQDGNVWGGEILLCNYEGYARTAHLKYQPMIGGDRCTTYPARMLASILLDALEKKEALELFNKLRLKDDLEYGKNELSVMISQYEKIDDPYYKESIPFSSSTGRIFDTVSYILGASKIKTYRGEPAMRLEALAVGGNPDKVKLNINYRKSNGIYRIDTTNLILDILKLSTDKNGSMQDIAACFQQELGNTFADLAIKIAKEHAIEKIGLTGGVAYNLAFSKAIKQKIIEHDFQYLEHDIIPPGDAGVSSGQLIAGIFEYKRNK
jgi:hydrogenase maturation protein HypF